MAAFAGIVYFDDEFANAPAENILTKAVVAGENRQARVHRLGRAVFVQRAEVSIRGGLGRSPMRRGGGGGALSGKQLFVASARLDNRRELADALAISPAALTEISDAELIQGMSRRWGDAGVARCLGAFVFAQWDAQRSCLTLGRDCLGRRALFFHRGRGFVAFATTFTGLLALPNVPRRLDEHVLANFLTLNLRERRRTFYRDIERVPSRTLVAIDRDRLAHRQYWSPNLTAPPPYRRDEDYVERARELFDQAVAAAMADTPRFAIAASGGLDSSAVAATAARLSTGQRIICYTIVPPPGTQIDVGARRYMDETDKMVALGKMYPALDLRFIISETTAPQRDEEVRLFATMNTPVLGPTVRLTGNYKMQDAVVAERYPAMLVGSFGNIGLSWKGMFSLLALLRAGKAASFLRELLAVARDSERDVLRTIAHDVVYAASPGDLKRLMVRLTGGDLESGARQTSLNPDFVAEAGLVRQWRAEGFSTWPGVSGWNPVRRRADFMFDQNQYSRDHAGMFEDLYGYDVRDPHADRRLLEFALTVPEPVYRRNGVPRSFARAVFADRLPRIITDERRRGAQAVTWFRQMQARRQDIADEVDRLEGSPMARRLIDLPRLKRLLDQWPKDEHAAQWRSREFRMVLARGVHVGRFIRWVEGGNA